jgi:hypothetical protein
MGAWHGKDRINMKRNELKQILKPLIKECIKECIFEEGVLSGIISEVAKGMSTNVVVETKSQEPVVDELRQRRAEEEYEKNRQEKIRRLNESAKFSSVNVFEGTTPIVESSGGSPMAGTHSEDAGIDISSFAGGKWKEIMKRSS